MIAGKARDERGAVDAVAVEFTGPGLGQYRRLGRRELPFELRLHGFDGQPGLLCGEELEETMRKEMHVGVGNQQRSPGRLSRDLLIGGGFTHVRHGRCQAQVASGRSKAQVA